MAQHIDKYGFNHPSEREANFANLAFDMMKYLTFDVRMRVDSAEEILSRLIDRSKEGQVARARFKAFIELTEKHHKTGAKSGKKG